MKHKILLLLLALFSFVLIGCKEDPVPEDLTEYNLLGGWVDGGDGVYTLTTNSEAKLAFTYDKGEHESAYLESAEITEDLSGMKKLTIKLKGMGAIKVELIAGNETKEISLNVVPNEYSYQWNLIDDGEFLKKLDKVRITGAPGKTGATGNVEISEMKFYNTEALVDIIQTGFNNIPDNVNEYDGTSETFNFNSKWERLVPEEEVYTITVEDGITKVSVEKSGEEWACIQALVKGDFTKFNYVVAKVKGTEGQPFILKAFENPIMETKVTLTGEEQYVAVDISGLTAEQKNSINKILIFGFAGLPTGSGYFEIIEAFMTEEWDTGIVKNVYDGTAETFPIHNWYDAGDSVYTIANDEETVFEYNKGNSEWARAESYIEGDISRFGKIVIEITGEEGKKVMFKVEGAGRNVEKHIEFDGTKQTVEIILTTLPLTTLKAIDKVMVFAAPGEKEVSGTFTLHSVTFMEDVVDVTLDWEDGGDGAYTFVENEDGTLTVNYDKAAGQDWALIKATYGEEYARFNTITIVLRGTAGKTVLLKPNDQGALEKSFTFEEGEDITYTVTTDIVTGYVVFAEAGTSPAEGSFTIVSVTLSFVRPEGPKAEADINKDWIDNGDGVYTVTENEDGTVTVDYNKGNKEYPALKQVFTGELAGYNTITLVLRGEAGKSIILKPNDNWELEKNLTFEEGKDLVFTARASEIYSMIIMAEGGTKDVTGSFTIVEAKLSCTEDVTKGWVDNGDGVYTVTENEDGTVTVDYNKGDKEYPALKQEFQFEGYNTITLVLKGEVGKTLILKPNDDWQLEETITFEDEEEFVYTASAEEITKMIIMAEGGTKEVTGSFTIVSAVLSFVETE